MVVANTSVCAFAVAGFSALKSHSKLAKNTMGTKLRVTGPSPLPPSISVHWGLRNMGIGNDMRL